MAVPKHVCEKILGAGMARNFAVDDQSEQGPDRPASTVRDKALGSAPAGKRTEADTLGPLRILVGAHLMRGELPDALRAARHLAKALPTQPDPVDLLIDISLEQGRAQLARQVLAAAEEEVGVPVAQAVHIKARIALSEGDFLGAKAVLVAAIEKAPDHPALRTLLTEVMVASGTAGDARAVLAHIGQPPVNPAKPGEVTADTVAELRATPMPETRLG
jgi:thioredoxin-like negative regulator of GroEL